MPIDYDQSIETEPSKFKLFRIVGSIFRQTAKTQVCNSNIDMTNRIVLVTGGDRGIGAGASSGFRDRGARVISASRGTGKTINSADFVKLDLAEIQSVLTGSNRIADILEGQKIDILCLNAGVSPKKNARSPDGFEMAYAVNCLGHQLLVERLVKLDCLASNARIIFTTGDIYCLADDCSSDYSYSGLGIMAYCRSKLGNIWQAKALAERFPQYTVLSVHPGVVASELEGGNDRISRAFKKAVMLPIKLGAQAKLIGATSPDIVSGSYFHNMHGIMKLRPNDPANNQQRAEQFSLELQEICKRSMPSRSPE